MKNNKVLTIVLICICSIFTILLSIFLVVSIKDKNKFTFNFDFLKKGESNNLIYNESIKGNSGGFVWIINLKI